MRLALILALLLSACTARQVGNALIPDELTLGRGKGTSEMDGKLDTYWSQDPWPVRMEGESESTYAALTWHLPSINDEPSRQEREDIRARSLLLDEQVAEEMASTNETMTVGGTIEADWRHAAAFGGLIVLLLVLLLIKLLRSNGWH